MTPSQLGLSAADIPSKNEEWEGRWEPHQSSHLLLPASPMQVCLNCMWPLGQTRGGGASSSAMGRVTIHGGCRASSMWLLEGHPFSCSKCNTSKLWCAQVCHWDLRSGRWCFCLSQRMNLAAPVTQYSCLCLSQPSHLTSAASQSVVSLLYWSEGTTRTRICLLAHCGMPSPRLGAGWPLEKV